jgi:hypothetical protein
MQILNLIVLFILYFFIYFILEINYGHREQTMFNFINTSHKYNLIT